MTPRRSARAWLTRAVLAGLALGAPLALLVAMESNLPAAPHPWSAAPLLYGVTASLATSVTVGATVLALLLRAWAERRRRSRAVTREAP